MQKFVNTTTNKGKIKTLTDFNTEIISENEIIKQYDNTCFVSDICNKKYQTYLKKQAKEQITLNIDFTFSELNKTKFGCNLFAKISTLEIKNNIITIRLNQTHFDSIKNYLEKYKINFKYKLSLYSLSYNDFDRYTIRIDNANNNFIVDNLHNKIVLKHK
jgi:hypothetical protein